MLTAVVVCNRELPTKDQNIPGLMMHYKTWHFLDLLTHGGADLPLSFFIFPELLEGGLAQKLAYS